MVINSKLVNSRIILLFGTTVDLLRHFSEQIQFQENHVIFDYYSDLTNFLVSEHEETPKDHYVLISLNVDVFFFLRLLFLLFTNIL